MKNIITEHDWLLKLEMNGLNEFKQRRDIVFVCQCSVPKSCEYTAEIFFENKFKLRAGVKHWRYLSVWGDRHRREVVGSKAEMIWTRNKKRWRRAGLHHWRCQKKVWGDRHRREVVGSKDEMIWTRNKKRWRRAGLIGHVIRRDEARRVGQRLDGMKRSEEDVGW